MSKVYRHSDGSYRDYPEQAVLTHINGVPVTHHTVGSVPLVIQPGVNYDITKHVLDPKHLEEEMYDAYYTKQEVIDGETAKENTSKKGLKFDNGKPPIHMIPEDAILGMAEAFAYGARKYQRFNYKNGIDITRLTDSLMRHTLAFLKGEDLDPESGLHHTKHILANAAMIEFMRINRPENDDRYKDGKD